MSGLLRYGVLSRGLLSGHWSKERGLASGGFHRYAPRFTGANLERNLALVEALRVIADYCQATVAQVAIAWVLPGGPDIGVLVGVRRLDALTEALAERHWRSATRICVASTRRFRRVPPWVIGYPPAVLQQMDSER